MAIISKTPATVARKAVTIRNCAPRSSGVMRREEREGSEKPGGCPLCGVSTLDQNCDLQLADLRRYARQRFSRAYEYVDHGVSGTQRCRPALDNLLKDARKRIFDVVLVWKFDRFARSLKHLMDSLEEFGTLGIDFVSFTEGIDTTTPTGQLLFHIVGAVAQFERDLIAERVRAGLAHARAMGKHIGRPRAQVDRDRVLVLRGQGKSLREIARRVEIPVSRVRRALNTGLQASSL